MRGPKSSRVYGAEVRGHFAGSIPVQLRIQLTAAAVTPPAEHAARWPAGAADAAAANADVMHAIGAI